MIDQLMDELSVNFTVVREQMDRLSARLKKSGPPPPEVALRRASLERTMVLAVNSLRKIMFGGTLLGMTVLGVALMGTWWRMTLRKGTRLRVINLMKMTLLNMDF